ncbi:MAG: hypothetical protein J5509_06035 [Lachnospiraceae bacterium]|nr:hypothetical protein [Lachnospiraceae bacterium]
MIKMLIRWGITRFKVNIRSLSFWLITALMTIVFLLSRSVAGRYNEDTVVLVYTGDEASEAADECFELMSADTPEGFVYERIYDEEDLKRCVSISEASCGVVFEGLTDENRGADDGWLTGTGSGTEDLYVTIYQASGSADGYVIREMVYPVIARMRAADELTEYVSGAAATDLGSILSGEAGDSARYAVSQYEEYTHSIDAGIYEIADIRTLDDRGSGRGDEAGSAIDVTDSGQSGSDDMLRAERSLRVLRTVFCGMVVLTAMLCLYDTVHTDRSFYRAFSHGKRAAFLMVRVLTTIVMSTVVSLAAFFLLSPAGH